MSEPSEADFIGAQARRKEDAMMAAQDTFGRGYRHAIVTVCVLNSELATRMLAEAERRGLEPLASELRRALGALKA